MKVLPIAAAADADVITSKEEEKKVLWFFTWYEEKYRRWFKIDPQGGSEEGINEICSMRSDGARGPNLDIVRGSGVAVVESSVYFIGGIRDFPLHEKHFKEVHVYNIKSGTWSKAPPINHTRINPFVFVVGRKIYVFGGNCFWHPKGMHIPEHEWVECYDLDSPNSSWKTFSAPIEDEETIKRFFSHHLDAAVVYQDQIRFWGPSTAGIFAFNLSSNTWSFTKGEDIKFLSCGNSPKPSYDFMSNHVVFGHLVLWQYRAKLYCWDLNKNTTVEFCTLKGVYYSPDINQTPSNLLHLGNGLLCLLRWSKIANRTTLCVYKFQIDETLLQSGTGGVHAAGIQSFDVPGSGIGHAILLDAHSSLEMNVGQQAVV